jgi:FtsH-binding integral membrane protein
MNEFIKKYQTSYTPVETSYASEGARKFLLNVYNWMAFGLGITAFTAVGINSVLTEEVLAQYSFLFFGVIILQLIVVFGLSFAINKIPSVLAIGAFFFYSFLTGITFSFLFLIYTSTSIASTFFICAAMFASVSVYGYITKTDLSKFGTFFFMALIGLIIASVVNLFLNNSTLYWLISYAGVIIFVGLTAYDTQRIKQMAQTQDFDTEQGKKVAIMGALRLYLDFINMFLFLLRILGNRK